MMLETVYDAWHGNLRGYANYLRVIVSGTRPDVFAMIEAEKQRSTFDVTQLTWVRALFLRMAVNNKMVWSDAGIRWVSATVMALAPINATTASRLLNTFQHVWSLKPPLQEKVRIELKRIVDDDPGGCLSHHLRPGGSLPEVAASGMTASAAAPPATAMTPIERMTGVIGEDPKGDFSQNSGFFDRAGLPARRSTNTIWRAEGLAAHNGACCIWAVS